jgi:hypothetical protein
VSEWVGRARRTASSFQWFGWWWSFAGPEMDRDVDVSSAQHQEQHLLAMMG